MQASRCVVRVGDGLARAARLLAQQGADGDKGGCKGGCVKATANRYHRHRYHAERLACSDDTRAPLSCEEESSLLSADPGTACPWSPHPPPAVRSNHTHTYFILVETVEHAQTAYAVLSLDCGYPVE